MFFYSNYSILGNLNYLEGILTNSIEATDGSKIIYNSNSSFGSGSCKTVYSAFIHRAPSTRSGAVAVAIFKEEASALFERELKIYRAIQANPPETPDCFLKLHTTFERALVVEQCAFNLHTLYDVKLHERRPDNPYSPAKLYQMALSLFQGMEYLHHQLKVVHRDIRPANVFIKHGTAKLADFKRSASINENAITFAYAKPAWSSPELLQHMFTGQDRITSIFSYKACDVYSMALTVWKLVWEEPMPEFFEPSLQFNSNTPFSSYKDNALIRSQMQKRLRYIPPQMDTELGCLMADMIARPHDRPGAQEIVRRYKRLEASPES